MRKRLKRFWRRFRVAPFLTLRIIWNYRKPQPWEREWHTERLRLGLVIGGKLRIHGDVEMRCCYEGGRFLGDDGWMVRLPGRPETVTLIR